MRLPFDDENVVLQVNGVPVLVDPVLMTNTEAKTDLNQKNIVIDGVNGFDFVQTGKQSDRTVMINGVPVTVPPR